MLQLYYGARFIIAHGKPTETITEGSLRNFPAVDNLENGLGNHRVAVEYRHIKLAYLDGEYCDCIESPLPFCGTTRDISCLQVHHSDSITALNFIHTAIITFHNCKNCHCVMTRVS